MEGIATQHSPPSRPQYVVPSLPLPRHEQQFVAFCSVSTATFFLPTRSWSMRMSFIELERKVVHPVSTPFGSILLQKPWHTVNNKKVFSRIVGSRHIQTRLVEPSANSLNSGDVFIVVTPKEVHLWNGRDATIMKKAKVNRIALFFFDVHK